MLLEVFIHVALYQLLILLQWDKISTTRILVEIINEICLVFTFE